MSKDAARNFALSEYWDPRETEITHYGCAETTLGKSKSVEQAPTSAILRGRLSGPGGLYNLGNVIALSAGIVAQLASSPANQTVRDSVAAYLFGNPGATWLSVAMIIFLVAGEVYHRAWASPTGPDVRLVKFGDLISGFGALAITAALVYFGDLVLAAVAGTLLAGGKFGTAILPRANTSNPKILAAADKWLRRGVVLSRFPSLAALVLEIVRSTSLNGHLVSAIMPAIMAFCFLLWLRADVLLLQASPGKGELK